MATTTLNGQALRKHLTLTDGFVLYTSAVLGQSLIVLPSIAARHAGPWSVLVWAALAAVSYPLARIMAELGARYPSAGGVITFIGHGLGQRIGWLTGILYLAAIVVGGPATALVFSEYVGKLIPLPAFWPFVVAGVVLAALIVGNCFDVSRVMRFQRWGFLGCLAAITVALLLALPHVTAARLTDVHGYDLAGVASTGLICFFAFVGWENAAFSGEEFADPRTLVKALGLAVVAVGALFVLLGVTVVGSLDRGVIATSDASLADLVRLSLGVAATRVAAAIALVLMILFMFTWARSATRLIYALAREGLLPRALAGVDAATGAPRRAAWALGGAWGVALAVQFILGVPIETYIQLSSGNFLLTYVLIVLAAWRLLDTRRYLLALVSASLAILLLVVAGFQSLWYALATAVVFAAVMAVRRTVGARRYAAKDAG
ncbi:MAG: putative amino acid permease, GabP family [Ktedonobacterales bacterium]|jgi:amino acid efflux transporter|nr:MAG: putative amino acid permease, GabP family [Ktedonobacterales bacterium]